MNAPTRNRKTHGNLTPCKCPGEWRGNVWDHVCSRPEGHAGSCLCHCGGIAPIGYDPGP